MHFLDNDEFLNIVSKTQTKKMFSRQIQLHCFLGDSDFKGKLPL